MQCMFYLLTAKCVHLNRNWPPNCGLGTRTDEDGRGRFIQGVAHWLACSFHQLILHDAHTGKIG